MKRVASTLAWSLACALFLSAPAKATYAGDLPETAETIATKIDVAGRQRMLSQRMASSVCLAALDIQREQRMQVLGKAHDLFVESRRALLYGDEKMGLRREKSRQVIQAMEQVDALWTPYSAMIQEARETGTVTPRIQSGIAGSSLPLLRAMHKSVGKAERYYGKLMDAKEDTRALNYAGLQRMLSQILAKEYCFISAGLTISESRLSLEASTDLFSKRLAILRDGDPNARVPAPTDPKVISLLAEVEAIWIPLEARFRAAAKDTIPTATDVEKTAVETDALLKASNAVVQAMVAAAE